MPDLPLPLTFRSELIELIATSIAAGESCALVGVGSSGKSNIVRFLRDRADAREHYFGEAARRILWLMIDCNALEAFDEPSLFLALLDSLARTVAARSDLGVIATALDGLYKETVAPGGVSFAYRNLTRALETLRTAGDFQCAFVLDDCDQLIQAAPPVLLRRLRALRDEFKYKLVYVTVTRREIVDLRQHSPEFETFYEILVVRSFAVGPYVEADARFMLDRLTARLPHPQALDPLAVRALINATGGHGGLLKAAFFVTRAGEDALDSDLIESLSTNPSLMDECSKIWDSLDKRDHEGLLAVVAGQPVSANARLPLLAKGLLHERTDGSHAIFCPVFENCVRQKAGLPVRAIQVRAIQAGAIQVRAIQAGAIQAGAIQAGAIQVRAIHELPLPEPHLEIYQGSRLVRINGNEITMTRAEFELLCRLYEKRGQDCRREDLLERVLNAETAEPSHLGGTIDETLDRAAAELKQKLEANGFAMPIIVSAEGEGYRMSLKDFRSL